MFGEIKVRVLPVISSLSAPALTHSTRNKTLGHVHQILLMSWVRDSQMFLCLYYQEKASISCSHILPPPPVSPEYILFYYEGRKLQCYCRNIDINCWLLFQVLATSSAVMISVFKQNGGNNATQTNGESREKQTSRWFLLKFRIILDVWANYSAFFVFINSL